VLYHFNLLPPECPSSIFNMAHKSRSLARLVDVGLIAAITIASLAFILRVGLVPSNPAAGVAVIYAPWTTPDQTMVRAVSAGARFVRFGGFPFIAVVMPEKPDYVARVLAGSALFAVDPQVLGACLPASFLKHTGVL
jgi:hypothetical protein